MDEVQNIQTERMIYLENWLKINQDENMTLEEWINIFREFSEEERNYLITAKILPIEEIEAAIKYYDGFNFPVVVDELTFINNLARKYSVDKNTIIKRIRQVRMINEIENSQIKPKKRKKEKKKNRKIGKIGKTVV